MATCNVTTLMADAGCFACLGPKEIQAVIAALLCRILKEYDPMAECDVQTLVNEATCFACLSPVQLSLVQVQLLCEILAVAGGAGGMQCDNADPVGAPVNACTMHYRTDTGALWLWDGAAWILATTGASAGVMCGLIDPVAPPASPCTLYYNTVNMGLWAWSGVAWHPLIAP